MKTIAIVTGASRGLGFATAQALAEKSIRVIFACRRIDSIKSEINSFKAKNLDVQAMELDVASEKSIQSFALNFKKSIGALDILVNNAGIFIDDEEGGDRDLLKTKSQTILKTFQTNTLGPFLLTQALWDLLQESPAGRVVNVSSGMGQLSDMNGSYAAYRISKTALNAVTRIFSAQAQGSSVLVNSVCPGWVKTEMGGPGASREIKQGIKGILWAAQLPPSGPQGGFFRDGEKLNW